MNNQRPVALTVFCILSWVWMAISAYGLIGDLANGQLSDDEIRQQELVMLESLSGEDPEVMRQSGWMVTETIGIIKITQANFGLLNGIKVLQLLIGLAAVILMFRLKKIGFHLYIIYSLISVIYWTYFFGEFKLGLVIALLSGLVSGLFVMFYAFQLKHMKS